MLWLFLMMLIVVVEYALQPFVSSAGEWHIALLAKTLFVALAFQLLLKETKNKAISFRSLIALFCIFSWVDLVGQLVWEVCAIDLAIPTMLIFSVWFILAAKREYCAAGDIVLGDEVFVMFLRPTTNIETCKALIGFPSSSVCIYANGNIWSFREKTGRFDTYQVNDGWLKKHIAINTKVKCSEQIICQLDRLCGVSRFPGVKCVWTIREILASLGDKFTPRWYEYIPGLYAMRIINGH